MMYGVDAQFWPPLYMIEQTQQSNKSIDSREIKTADDRNIRKATESLTEKTAQSSN